MLLGVAGAPEARVLPDAAIVIEGQHAKQPFGVWNRPLRQICRWVRIWCNGAESRELPTIGL